MKQKYKAVNDGFALLSTKPRAIIHCTTGISVFMNDATMCMIPMRENDLLTSNYSFNVLSFIEVGKQ